MKRNPLLARVCRAVMVCIACLFLVLYCVPAKVASAQSNAYVRVIHASPFVGTADVFVDGTKLLSSFQFASVTDYVPVPQGNHKVQIALVGKGIDASVITQVLAIQPGYSYTVAALGDKPNALSLKVFVDNNQVVPNLPKVRVYYLVPDAGNVNVTVGGNEHLNNVAYPSASDYLKEDVGPCTFSFNNTQFANTLPITVDLKANTVTSVFEVGLYNGSPKVQLVNKLAPGIPGLPNTGSAPVIADAVLSQPWLSWLLIVVLLALIGVVPVIRIMKRVS